MTKTKILRFWAKKDDFVVLADNMILFWWKNSIFGLSEKISVLLFRRKTQFGCWGEGGCDFWFWQKKSIFRLGRKYDLRL